MSIIKKIIPILFGIGLFYLFVRDRNMTVSEIIYLLSGLWIGGSIGFIFGVKSESKYRE